MIRDEEEILDEIDWLNETDKRWCDNPDESNLEDAIRYLAMRDALEWVLKKREVLNDKR